MSSVRTAVVAAAFALAGWGAASAVAHSEPPSPPPPAPKTTIDADGTYTVGKDIAPGNYASAGPVGDGTCSWKRADATGATIDNAITHQPQVITIAPTDATFRTRDCQAWALTDAAPPPSIGNLQAQVILGTLNGLTGGLGQAPAARPPAYDRAVTQGAGPGPPSP